MRAILMVFALLFCSAALAQQVPLTPAWSGIWSDAAGQYRCALQVSAANDTLAVLCTLGRSGGGYAGGSPAVPGWTLFLQRANADFGTAPAGQSTWGQVQMVAVCDAAGPALYSAAYSAPITVGFTLRPVAVDGANKLCAARIGGGR